MLKVADGDCDEAIEFVRRYERGGRCRCNTVIEAELCAVRRQELRMREEERAE
jgi:hypothetical protein